MMLVIFELNAFSFFNITKELLWSAGQSCLTSFYSLTRTVLLYFVERKKKKKKKLD